MSTFHATCTRLREDHVEVHSRLVAFEKMGRSTEGLPKSEFCSESFATFAEAEGHMKEVHPTAYRKQRRKEPKMSGARKRPFGAPAVKHEEQSPAPGTEFTTKHGYPAQVVGAVSRSQTKFLAWLPDGANTGRNNKPYRYWECGQDEQGRWMWEFTVPTKVLLESLAEQEAA